MDIDRGIFFFSENTIGVFFFLKILCLIMITPINIITYHIIYFYLFIH